MSSNLKAEIHKQCMAFVEEKIQNAQQAIEMAKEAIEEEEKNTTGDKFESGRAMMQIEVEKFSRQLSEALKLKQALLNLKPRNNGDAVSLGSLIITNSKSFYVSIPAGKILIDKKEFFAVSPSSPIMVHFMGKRKGDEVKFNGQTYFIVDLQ